MALEDKRLHIFFFPVLSRGHIIPTLGIAKLLAERGMRSTIVTTPGNASIFSSAIETAVGSGHRMQLLLLPFPDVGLPAGVENTFDVTSDIDKLKFGRAMDELERPLRQLLQDHRPDCLVGDMAGSHSMTSAARSTGTPFVEFCALSAFSIVVIDELLRVFPSCINDDVTRVSGIPHSIRVTKTELPCFFHHLDPSLLIGGSDPDTAHTETEREIRPPVVVVVNTFRELAPEYVELMKQGGRRKVLCVGPLHLISSSSSTTTTKIDKKYWERIKNWLDSREAAEESVLYVSFGSECCFPHDQLREIASGLESSGQPFVWVVRAGGGGGAESIEDWLPRGFRERVGDRGLVLTEWAPQTSILGHRAVGGSVVHCGWNSSIEAVGAGLPVIAWPLHTEQFINERLLVEVLGIGVRVLDGDMRIVEQGKKKLLGGEKVKEAVLKLFGKGEEAEERRRKAKEYGKLARSAMEEGGSSAVDMDGFIKELTELCNIQLK